MSDVDKGMMRLLSAMPMRVTLYLTGDVAEMDGAKRIFDYANVTVENNIVHVRSVEIDNDSYWIYEVWYSMKDILSVESAYHAPFHS